MDWHALPRCWRVYIGVYNWIAAPSCPHIAQVSNAESTLNVTEKKFFHRVNANVSRPKNLFIQYNRWDSTDEEGDPTMVALARKQHMANAKQFIVDELHLCDESQCHSNDGSPFLCFLLVDLM